MSRSTEASEISGQFLREEVSMKVGSSPKPFSEFFHESLDDGEAASTHNKHPRFVQKVSFHQVYCTRLRDKQITLESKQCWESLDFWFLQRREISLSQKASEYQQYL